MYSGMKRFAWAGLWSNPRRRKWLLWSGGAFLLYTLGGFLLVPALVKWQLLKQLPPATHRLASVREVKCNPFALSLTVRGLALTETNGAPFAGFEEFYANFQLSSIFRLAWTFDALRLQEPRAEIVLAKDGQFNFANLFVNTNAPPPSKTEQPAGLPSLLIFNLVVTNGYVGFVDLTRQTPFHTAYEPINLHLTHFTTEPDRRSPYSFKATGDSGRLIAWTGTITAQPSASSGTLQIEGIALPKFAPYLADFTRAQLTAGTLDVEGDYHFASDTNGLDLAVSNLAATVTGFALKDPDSGEKIVALSAYELRDGSFDWRTRQVRIGSLAVKDPSVLVRRRADGTINLPSLVLPRATPANAPAIAPTNPPPADSPWVFTLDDYRLERGTVQFVDAMVPGPFRTTLQPVSVRLEHFTTAPNTGAALHADVTTEAAETISLAADCSINPIQATGQLKLGAIDLKKYQPYLAPFFRGQVVAGKTDCTVEFSERHQTNSDDMTVSNAVVRVSDLQIKSPDGGETVVKVPSFAVESVTASLAAKAVHVGAIQSSGATILARRDANGAINLLDLLATNAPSANTTNASPPPAAGAPWRIVLDELALRDYALHLEDRQTPKPGVLDVDQLALKLSGVHYPSNAPVQLDFTTRVNAAGSVTVRSLVWPYSPATDAELEIAGLDLRGFQPWIEPMVKLSINRGALNTKGRVRFAPGDGPGPTLHFTGDLDVTNLLTSDQVLFKEFVRWDELTVNGIDLGLQPNQAKVAQVRFAGLKTSVIIGPDKRPNFLAILPAATETNTTPAPATTAAEPFPIQLGELKFENASIHFGDQSIQPPCSFDLKQFAGTIQGLSTKKDSQAEVALAGKVDDSSPFGLHGTVHPLANELALDSVFTNRNLQLTPFAPYMAKYVGHPLNKGRLSLNLDYSIHTNALKAENQVRIDQLMLGPRNDSPDAPKLPIKLAVALLKDNDGRIELDLPLSNRIDDPNFNLLPIIGKVIGNVIVKAAASPFKLLGALVGGGEEMSYVDFAPGQAQLMGSETNKLDKLVRALEKRPALNLEIEGSFNPAADRDALARDLVQEQIKAARLKELSAIGQTPPAGESFQIGSRRSRTPPASERDQEFRHQPHHRHSSAGGPGSEHQQHCRPPGNPQSGTVQTNPESVPVTEETRRHFPGPSQRQDGRAAAQTEPRTGLTDHRRHGIAAGREN